MATRKWFRFDPRTNQPIEIGPEDAMEGDVFEIYDDTDGRKLRSEIMDSNMAENTRASMRGTDQYRPESPAIVQNMGKTRHRPGSASAREGQRIQGQMERKAARDAAAAKTTDTMLRLNERANEAGQVGAAHRQLSHGMSLREKETTIRRMSEEAQHSASGGTNATHARGQKRMGKEMAATHERRMAALNNPNAAHRRIAEARDAREAAAKKAVADNQAMTKAKPRAMDEPTRSIDGISPRNAIAAASKAASDRSSGKGDTYNKNVADVRKNRSETMLAARQASVAPVIAQQKALDDQARQKAIADRDARIKAAGDASRTASAPKLAAAEAERKAAQARAEKLKETARQSRMEADKTKDLAARGKPITKPDFAAAMAGDNASIARANERTLNKGKETLVQSPEARRGFIAQQEADATARNMFKAPSIPIPKAPRSPGNQGATPTRMAGMGPANAPIFESKRMSLVNTRKKEEKPDPFRPLRVERVNQYAQR